MFALVRKNQRVAVLCWLGGRGRAGQSIEEKWVRTIALQVCAPEITLQWADALLSDKETLSS